MHTRWFSLKHRLLALLLGGVTLTWLATIVLSHGEAHSEVDQLFDAQLERTAQTLLTLASLDDGTPAGRLDQATQQPQRGLRFQLWRADGQMLARSGNAPLTPLTDDDTGFSETHDLEHGHWRHYSQWNRERTIQVQICEDHQVRDERIGHIAWRLAMPALLGLPLLGLWVWIAIRRGLRPLDGIARQIAHRDPQQLQAIAPSTAPAEIRPLLEALNDLFARVQQALDNERRFTADAAHELRTPLAALQAQLQVAQRARDDGERRQSLEQLQAGLHRAAHLVDQMLQLARLDPESGLPDRTAVDLAALAETVCAELGPAILARDLDFELNAPQPAPVSGQPEWLRVLLRNLIDNAIRYAGHGGRVRVSIEGGSEGDSNRGIKAGNETDNPPGSSAREKTVLLAVDDDGPGIPAAERHTVRRRFHRLARNGEPGCGLGLAIVDRIAELHGTQLELHDSPFGHGLRASLRLPAPH